MSDKIKLWAPENTTSAKVGDTEYTASGDEMTVDADAKDVAALVAHGFTTTSPLIVTTTTVKKEKVVK